MDQLILISICTISPPKIAEYTFFPSSLGIFYKIDFILGYKKVSVNLGGQRLYQSLFSEHNFIKLDINCMRKIGKEQNMWKLNNVKLKNQ